MTSQITKKKHETSSVKATFFQVGIDTDGGGTITDRRLLCSNLAMSVTLEWKLSGVAWCRFPPIKKVRTASGAVAPVSLLSTHAVFVKNVTTNKKRMPLFCPKAVAWHPAMSVNSCVGMQCTPF